MTYSDWEITLGENREDSWRTGKVLHLLSGGLDSVTLLHLHVEEGTPVACLFFNYGQDHYHQEVLKAINAAEKCGATLIQTSLPELGDDLAKPVVPHRNAIFLAHALNVASQIGADQITIGCNATDHARFEDCRPEFIQAFNAMAKASGSEASIYAPFLNMQKREIAKEAKRLNLRASDFWTCYKGRPDPCGECVACRALEGAWS